MKKENTTLGNLKAIIIFGLLVGLYVNAVSLFSYPIAIIVTICIGVIFGLFGVKSKDSYIIAMSALVGAIPLWSLNSGNLRALGAIPELVIFLLAGFTLPILLWLGINAIWLIKKLLSKTAS